MKMITFRFLSGFLNLPTAVLEPPVLTAMRMLKMMILMMMMMMMMKMMMMIMIMMMMQSVPSWLKLELAQAQKLELGLLGSYRLSS